MSTLKKNVPAFQFNFVAVPGDPNAENAIQMDRLQKVFPDVSFDQVVNHGSDRKYGEFQGVRCLAILLNDAGDFNTSMMLKEGMWLVERDTPFGGTTLCSISDELAQSGNF